MTEGPGSIPVFTQGLFYLKTIWRNVNKFDGVNQHTRMSLYDEWVGFAQFLVQTEPGFDSWLKIDCVFFEPIRRLA